jgi:hypothetical protein
VLQQLQWVCAAVPIQPVCQHAAPCFNHTGIPVLQQLLKDAGALLDAAETKGASQDTRVSTEHTSMLY